MKKYIISEAFLKEIYESHYILCRMYRNNKSSTRLMIADVEAKCLKQSKAIKQTSFEELDEMMKKNLIDLKEVS